MYKILWITNTPLNEVKRKLGKPESGTGTWYDNLLMCLKETNKFQFHIICPCLEKSFKFRSDDILFYCIKSGLNLVNVSDRSFLRKVFSIIDNVKPDVIHIHGTERISGLLKYYYPQLKIPIVISMQGLTKPIYDEMKSRIIYFISIGFKSHGSIFNVVNYILQQIKWINNLRISSHRERKIIELNTYFFGRTDFDKDYIFSLNNKARYFHEPRILRKQFYLNKWNYNDIEKQTLLVLNARGPSKNVEILIVALSYLKNKYRNIKLKIGGISENSIYSQYLLMFAEQFKVRNNVEFLGYLTELDTIRALKQAHIFCLTSYIENSPNTLAEAQIMGVPSIAHITGGVKSYVNEDSTMFFWNNNSNELAEKIDLLFSNPESIISKSENLFLLARQRHDISKVQALLGAAYCDLIKLSVSQTKYE